MAEELLRYNSINVNPAVIHKRLDSKTEVFTKPHGGFFWHTIGTLGPYTSPIGSGGTVRTYQTIASEKPLQKAKDAVDVVW